MHFQSQLFFPLILATILVFWAQRLDAMPGDADGAADAALNTLYNNLLQREYAEPVIFPNHQVERKAQRSPSLRLRFGRRSDPDWLSHTPEKRWFDEVNQKPIRSPSLRLRFGRRSDPLMPMHSPLDMLMNEAYENQAKNGLYDDNEVTLADNEDDFYNTLMHSQKLRNLLMFLNNYARKDIESLPTRLASSSAAAGATGSSASLEEDMDEYERAIRKPGPLRLRWGRSTGGLRLVATNDINAKNDLEQKNKVNELTNEVEKSLNPQTKD